MHSEWLIIIISYLPLFFVRLFFKKQFAKDRAMLAIGQIGWGLIIIIQFHLNALGWIIGLLNIAFGAGNWLEALAADKPRKAPHSAVWTKHFGS